MKKLLFAIFVLPSCMHAVYELPSRAGWVKIERKEIVRRYNYPDMVMIHYKTDRKVARYAEIPLRDSGLYVVGRRYLMLEGR